jgi:molybdopterin/thiamine biosynthesis adenylyltransferase
MDQTLYCSVSKDYKAVILDPTSSRDSSRISELLETPGVILCDTLLSQVEELIKICNPSQRIPSEDLKQQAHKYIETHSREMLCNYVYFPWRNTVTVLLKEADFVQLRTSRNKYKITQEEQDILATKKIGVIGLSVGQSVALSLAMERSFGELRIADFDTLELSNMNRIRTSVVNLGLKKAHIVAREIAEVDPYLKVTLFEEGINSSNMEEFFTSGGSLDLLIEECDSLPVKIESRLMAKSMGIPVLMDTSDRGMIDIERFDLEPERPIFHGKLLAFGGESELLDNLEENYQKYLLSILDFEKLSERAQSSIGEIGKSITTWPQLASSVLMGGAACSHYAKAILLQQIKVSGREYVDLDQYLFENK